MFSNSGPLTDIKFMPASLATAFAKSVLPHPGGPHNNTPMEVGNPTSAKCLGYFTGAWEIEQIQLNCL